MSATRLPRLGSVAWAELQDANGFSKVRPVVVITPTAQIAAAKAVRVVAITTRLPETLSGDHLLLPWDRQGKARSGLRQRCAAVASWQAEIPVDHVQEVVGILSPTVIGELLTKVSATLLAPDTTPARGRGNPAAQTSEGTKAADPPTTDLSGESKD